MKLLALLLALFWSSTAGAARTPFQARCEDTIAKSSAELVSRQAGYAVDNTKTLRQLTSLKGPGAQRGVVLGLTRTESHVTIDATGSILHDRDSNYECIAPHLVVNLWYSPITVLDASLTSVCLLSPLKVNWRPSASTTRFPFASSV